MTDPTKILIIETEAVIRMAFSQLRESQGFQGLEAANGQSGLALAEHECPEVVLCEIRLPGIDGFEVLRQVRSHQQLAQTRFIFLATFAFSDTCRRALQMGANDALTKPIENAELLRAIADQISKNS